MRMWSKIDGGDGDMYCDICEKVHPQYLMGCVPRDVPVYHIDAAVREEERRRLISKSIVENTKSF